MPKFNINLNRNALNLSVSAAREKAMIVPRIGNQAQKTADSFKALPISAIYLNGAVGKIGYNRFRQIPYTFTATKTTAKNYEIYGELPAGEIVLSVRTPRTKNLIPFPYWGVMAGPGGSSWSPSTNYDSLSHASLAVTEHDDGTFEWAAQTTANFKSMIRFEMFRAVFPAGTYTASHCMGTYLPGFGVYTYNLDGTQRASYEDNNPSGYGTGIIVFTETEPFLVAVVLYCAENYSYSAGYSRPQLERGSSVTEYEPPNPATLTTITLPRALEEGEYLSFSDQKIMPTGTPVTLPALQTLVGENVLMIENYPRLTSKIILDL